MGRAPPCGGSEDSRKTTLGVNRSTRHRYGPSAFLHHRLAVQSTKQTNNRAETRKSNRDNPARRWRSADPPPPFARAYPAGQGSSHAAKSALYRRQALIGRYHLLTGELAGRHTGANHIDP